MFYNIGLKGEKNLFKIKAKPHIFVLLALIYKYDDYV